MRDGGGGFPAGLFAMAALAAIFILWPRESRAAAAIDYGSDAGPGEGDAWSSDNSGDAVIQQNDPLPAFLYMIRSAENRSVPDPQRYNRFYANIQFSGLADHPVATGELEGIHLSDAMCRAAGFSTGCVSTAAGAYQLILPTWQRYRQAGAWGPYLPDFGVASQDEAARRILQSSGALGELVTGNFSSAVRIASKTWASLPGSTAQQGGVSFADTLALFTDGQRIFG